MKYALVVPSNREANIKHFLIAWAGYPWDIIVVEDGPEKSFSLQEGIFGTVYHYCWSDIDEHLGQDSWIISRQDSAIRSFGFLQAYKLGAEVIFTLDDDCFPMPSVLPDYYICYHLDHLNETEKWTELVPQMRTRGLPYFNMGRMTNVVANVGLWTGIPDLDAVQTLANGEVQNFQPPDFVDRIIPPGQYFPWCGMNFCFRREITPLAYFPLMGDGQPYRRFDDIWFGIIAKKVLDHLGLAVSVGEPFVKHHRASLPMVNLVKEAPGIAYNERFWQLIDTIPLTASEPKLCMVQIGKALRDIHSEPDYINRLGSAIVAWAGLF